MKLEGYGHSTYQNDEIMYGKGLRKQQEQNSGVGKNMVIGATGSLKDLIGTDKHEQIIELPQDYQWLRISLNKHKDSPTKKVIHWTGPRGKQFIRETLMKGGVYKGQQV